MSEEKSNPTPGSAESWHEVGQQFKALGESLAAALRTAWENEETQQHLRAMQAGVESMVTEVGQAMQQVATSPEGQQVRAEVEKAAVNAREAARQSIDEARPQLVSALQQVNAELQKLLERLQGHPPERPPEG